MALSARPAGRGRRQRDDMDQPDRHHAGGLCADRHAGGAVGLSGGICRYHPGRQRPCHGLSDRARWTPNGQIDRTHCGLRGDGRTGARRARRDPRCTVGARAGDGQLPASAMRGSKSYGIAPENLKTIPRIADPEHGAGRYRAISTKASPSARAWRGELGVSVGDRIKLISPNGVKTAFGTSPRVNAYEVVYIFTAGRYDIDRTRVYLPFAEAQIFLQPRRRGGRAGGDGGRARTTWTTMALPCLQAARRAGADLDMARCLGRRFCARWRSRTT